MMTTYETTVVKSVHIKECWPFEYKVEEKYRFTPKNPRTKAQKASANNLANWRKKAAQVKTPKGQKLLKLPVYELDIDFCERLNNANR